MTDLISREYMFQALGIFNDRENGDPHFLNGIETAREIVENAPVVDAEPVVHCRDCEHCYFASNRAPDEQCYVCGRLGLDVIPDWYCACGERRVDDGKAD